MSTASVSHPGAQAFRERLVSPPLLKSYMSVKLPLAAFAGLKILRLDGYACEVTVPYGWRTRNPFGSIYFAALSMAAELSTGSLALMAARGSDDRVSALPVGMEATFEQKATDLTTFTCTEGPALFDAVSKAIRTGEGVIETVSTVGRLPDGSIAARFKFSWSFKKKA